VSEAEGPNTMRELVLALGLDPRDVDRATADGTLGLLAVSSFIFPEKPIYTQAEAIGLTGLGDDVSRYWRALGFPDPLPDEKAFSQADIDVLRVVKQLVDVGLVEEDVALQMGRVIGVSMARIAAAQIDAIEARVDEVGPEAAWGRDHEGTDPAVLRAGMLQTTMPQILEYAWRRHMQVAAYRRMIRDSATLDGESAGLAVGFADLVGFTALSQQLDDHALAEVVERFERTAYDIVGGFGGRVVKMIGDEVMYDAVDVGVAVRIGLALADAYHADDAMSDVRVGIAYGPVLEREGDLFGPTVNLASRIVGIAYEGSVVVGPSVHEALADDPALHWKHMRARQLKHIGRVQLWTVRAVGDGFDREGGLERAWRRRGQLRDRVAELVDRIVEPAITDAGEEEE
jgi:adenylate cyclase